MAEPKTSILDDLPTDQDRLDFKPYVETLVDVCKTAGTPLTIGVFGTWGSGKTSLMRMIKKGLPRNFTVVWFDAWKYDKEETLWRTFLLAVLSAVRETTREKGNPTEDLDRLETLLYQAIDIEKAGGVTIDLLKLGGNVAKGAVQIGLSFIPGGAVLGELIKTLQEKGTESLTDDVTRVIQRERTRIHIEQVRFLEKFQEKFRILIEENIVPSGQRSGRLVVFVDDLDRCLPEKAIEVLEAIKLFVDVPGCVFILGLDQDVIARGVEIRYKDFDRTEGGQTSNPIDGARYLEKIIQLPFQIPQIESTDMDAFVSGLVDTWPRPECPQVFAEGLGENPRQVKRTVNTFLMLWGLAGKRQLQDTVRPIRLAKVVAIQNIAPKFYDSIKRNHTLLRDVEAYYRAEGSGQEGGRPPEVTAVGSLGARRQESASVQLSQGLLTLLSRTPSVAKIIKLFPDLEEASFKDIPYEELEAYFTLTLRAEAPLPASQAQEPQRALFEPQVVRIPAGRFLMGSTKVQAQKAIKDGASKNRVEYEQPRHIVELSEYLIGKYPVTNQQYQAFVKEGGKAPQGWDNDQYAQGLDSHPVVNVSWEDALTYCKWLGGKTNKAYRLPTEAEWEKAARGEDGRIWPWGNEFGEKNANTAEAGIGATTPIGQFSPQGDSPYGCTDMIGNVWEWCSDWFDENEYSTRQDGTKDPQGPPSHGQARVVRGGSFDDFRRGARCASRDWDLPSDLSDIIGFRVVISPITKSEL